jgi:hypothetical protein
MPLSCDVPRRAQPAQYFASSSPCSGKIQLDLYSSACVNSSSSGCAVGSNGRCAQCEHLELAARKLRLRQQEALRKSLNTHKSAPRCVVDLGIAIRYGNAPRRPVTIRTSTIAAAYDFLLCRRNRNFAQPPTPIFCEYYVSTDSRVYAVSQSRALVTRARPESRVSRLMYLIDKTPARQALVSSTNTHTMLPFHGRVLEAEATAIWLCSRCPLAAPLLPQFERCTTGNFRQQPLAIQLAQYPVLHALVQGNPR